MSGWIKERLLPLLTVAILTGSSIALVGFLVEHFRGAPRVAADGGMSTRMSAGKATLTQEEELQMLRERAARQAGGSAAAAGGRDAAAASAGGSATVDAARFRRAAMDLQQAQALMQAQQMARAEAKLTSAIALLEYRSSPSDAFSLGERDILLYQAIMHRVPLLLESGRLVDALDTIEALLQATKGFGAQRVSALPELYTLLVRTLTQLGRYDAADAAIRTAKKLAESMPAEARSQLHMTMEVNEADVAYLCGDYERSVRLNRQIVDMLTPELGRDHPMVNQRELHLVGALHALGRFDEANAQMSGATTAAADKDADQALLMRYYAAYLLLMQGDVAGAARVAEQGVAAHTAAVEASDVLRIAMRQLFVDVAGQLGAEQLAAAGLADAAATATADQKALWADLRPHRSFSTWAVTVGASCVFVDPASVDEAERTAPSKSTVVEPVAKEVEKDDEEQVTKEDEDVENSDEAAAAEHDELPAVESDDESDEELMGAADDDDDDDDDDQDQDQDQKEVKEEEQVEEEEAKEEEEQVEEEQAKVEDEEQVKEETTEENEESKEDVKEAEAEAKADDEPATRQVYGRLSLTLEVLSHPVTGPLLQPGNHLVATFGAPDGSSAALVVERSVSAEDVVASLYDEKRWHLDTKGTSASPSRLVFETDGYFEHARAGPIDVCVQAFESDACDKLIGEHRQVIRCPIDSHKVKAYADLPPKGHAEMRMAVAREIPLYRLHLS